MPMLKILSPEQIFTELKSLPGWSLRGENSAISCIYKFSNFSMAFGFMAQVALIAEKLDHHPDWTNVNNQVDICFSTHEAGGVTELDIQLAGVVNRLKKSIQT